MSQDSNSKSLSDHEAYESSNHFHTLERWSGLAHQAGGYEISGCTNPDYNGSYYAIADLFGGTTQYKNKDGAGYLWWSVGDTAWEISATIGVKGVAYFERIDPSPIGAYTNQGTATGTVLGADIPDEAHVSDIDSMSPFRLISGNDTYGPWVQIKGTDDGPYLSGRSLVDTHRIGVDDVQVDKVKTRIQFAYGTVDAATAYALDNYSEIMVKPLKSGEWIPFPIRMFRIPISGYMIWARCWISGENGKWLDLFTGHHEYLK